jgi:Tfp pilus assembly protein PilV
MRRIKGLSQAGDTIVEVLISIAVISLVLVGAYTSTDHNIANTQDAQERTQAVKLVETQLEYLRTAGSATDNSCFTGGVNNHANTGAVPNNPCILGSDGSQITDASTQPQYSLSITLTDGVYSVTAQWPSLVSTGNDNVTMYYEL